MSIVTLTSTAPTFKSLSKRNKDWLVSEINQCNYLLNLTGEERVTGTYSMSAFELAELLHPMLIELGRRGQEAFDLKLVAAIRQEKGALLDAIEESDVDALQKALGARGFEIREKGW